MYPKWKSSVLGRRIDTDGVYGSQCVDVVTNYIQYTFNRPWRQVLNPVSGAKDLFAAAHDQYFDKIRNNKADVNQVPRQGDICVYDKTPTNPYGHAGVVEGADKDGVMLVQQDGSIDTNRDGNADGVCFVKFRRWGQSPCIGWLRPKITIAPASVIRPTPAPPVQPQVPVAPQVWNVNTINGIIYTAVEGSTEGGKYYIANPDGANLWDFGKATTWRDFKAVKHYRYGDEVYIVGKAFHPIPPKGAEYKMLPEHFGNFKSSGNPTNTYGFNYADLSRDQPVPKAVIPPLPTITHVVPSSAPIDAVVGKLPEASKPNIPISTDILEEGPYKGWKAGWYYVREQLVMPDLSEQHDPIKVSPVFPLNPKTPDKGKMYIQGFTKKWNQWYAVALPGKFMNINGNVQELTMAQRESYRFVMPCTNLYTSAQFQEAVQDQKAAEYKVVVGGTVRPEDQTAATRNESVYGKMLNIGGMIYAFTHVIWAWIHKQKILNIQTGAHNDDK